MKQERRADAQVGILADRYLEVLFGDAGGTLLLLAQAPLLGVGISGVWSNRSSDTPSLYFVLCLSAFFLGTVNAAREVVKERDLFLRERMFNLRVSAYVLSKYRVQAILVVLQSLIMGLIVRLTIPLEVGFAWLLSILTLVAFAGTAVGLLVSSLVKTSDKAMAAVPLVVIPQLLFSDFVIGQNALENWTGWVQSAQPVSWAYEAMRELMQKEPQYFDVIGGIVVLLIMIVGCHALTRMRLSAMRY